MLHVPAVRSVTKRASFRTRRCWETAGRVTGRRRAISATELGPADKISKTLRLVASLRAAIRSGGLIMGGIVSRHEPLVNTYPLLAVKRARWVERALPRTRAVPSR